MKACIACEHFSIDLGSAGYSSLTPGYSGSVDCAKNKFNHCGEGYINPMPDLVDTARDCPEYKITDDAKQRGFTP